MDLKKLEAIETALTVLQYPDELKQKELTAIKTNPVAAQYLPATLCDRIHTTINYANGKLSMQDLTSLVKSYNQLLPFTDSMYKFLSPNYDELEKYLCANA